MTTYRPARVGAIWARVSDDKGQDVEGQVRELAALAARMGLSVPPEFVFRIEKDGAHSAFRGDPPQKKAVLELARRRKFDVLLIWSLDRWSRRRKDGAREVFDVLPAYGVTVVSHEEPFISTEGIPEGFRDILGRLMLWLAEEESARKSARVKLRYQTNRNRAAGGGGKAKWGRGRVPSPEEVERIMTLTGEGMSVRNIAGQTGVPKSTVGRLVSQTSRGEGMHRPPESTSRPEGALGTPAVSGQNSIPVVSGAPSGESAPGAKEAVSGGGGA